MTNKKHPAEQDEKKARSHEADQTGFETLLIVSNAGNFNRWMYEKIAPHCKGRILEAGSGIGSISVHFLRVGQSIMLSDIRSDYCEKLTLNFGHFSNLEGVVKMNLTDPDFESRHRTLLGSFDTVFALNVIEHIENDLLAIQNCRRMLRKNGRLVVLVPAFQWLYNGLDLELQHCRRYNARTLGRLLEAAQLKVLHKSYFNALGIPGWFVSGGVQRNKTLPESQMALFNAMVPLAKWIDKGCSRLLGLSIVMVGEV